jgi:hypothetical protein
MVKIMKRVVTRRKPERRTTSSGTMNCRASDLGSFARARPATSFNIEREGSLTTLHNRPKVAGRGTQKDAR